MFHKDVTAFVELLIEAEDAGVDVASCVHGQGVLIEFTVLLSHSIKLLDSLYYTLVKAYML